MADLNEANEKLIDLIFMGFDHGIDSIKENTEPLIPFLMTATNGEINLERFATDQLEDGPIRARQRLSVLDNKPNFAVIAFDGFITIEETKFDAVIVEGYDKNDRTAYVLAQRYQRSSVLSRLKTVGNPAFIGTAENIILEM